MQNEFDAEAFGGIWFGLEKLQCNHVRAIPDMPLRDFPLFFEVHTCHPRLRFEEIHIVSGPSEKLYKRLSQKMNRENCFLEMRSGNAECIHTPSSLKTPSAEKKQFAGFLLLGEFCFFYTAPGLK